MTDPACTDAVTRLVLEMADGGPMPPFTPGQFVRIGVPGTSQPAPAYFAIASDPEARGSWEFFVKCAGGISGWLCRAEAGTELEVEGPMGKGFDIAAHEGRDVYLIGVGTGIAPLRSVWHHILRHRERYGRVAIYAGFLTPLHRLLTDELESLSAQGIEVSVTLEMGGGGWEGPIGYVQHALEADAPDGSHAVACLAGMSAMVDACRETLQNLGFDDSRILLNY
ncbi:MAG: FAD-binding oxidoreductase [Mariprofundaceae bacterium]